MSTLRFTICLLIAPLAIPLIDVPPWTWNSIYLLPVIFVTAVFAYLGSFLFGFLAYLVLRARRWTTIWFAPAAGFMVAGLTCWLVGSFGGLLAGGDLFDVHHHLDLLRQVLWPYGPVGAFFGTLLWVLARLDPAESYLKTMTMARAVIAFLVAPLVVPILTTIELRELLSQPPLAGLMLLFCTFTAYVGTFVFGIPTYLFLRTRRWTAFWLAPVLGFVAGGLAWWLCKSVPMTGGTFHFDPDPRLLRAVLWPFGPLGALVGSLLWLIARPDRATRRDRAPHA